MYSVVTGIVNVVIFAAYSSQCAIYFEKCGQHCVNRKSVVYTCILNTNQYFCGAMLGMILSGHIPSFQNAARFPEKVAQ